LLPAPTLPQRAHQTADVEKTLKSAFAGAACHVWLELGMGTIEQLLKKKAEQLTGG
jgi:hypothetical protein